MTATEVAYYAVPDSDDPQRMTYWRRGPRGLTTWPPRARYGPRLLRRDVPANLVGSARTEWLNAWWAEHRQTWDARVFADIYDDEPGAAARFAALTIRCCCCGRRLTDPVSKTYGIGPDCRDGLPDAILATLAEAVGRAHAKHLGEHAGGQA